MANSTLCCTAVTCTLLHLLTMLVYTPPLIYATFILLALMTSILNHGFTSPILKYLDRTVMIVGIPVTLWMAPTLSLRILTGLVAAVYFLGKTRESTFLHAIAHFLITFINIRILMLLYGVSTPLQWSSPV